VADAINELLSSVHGDSFKATQDNETAEQLSQEEALALYIDVKFTKDQYNQIRAVLTKRNCNLLPSYNKVLEAKKECYSPTLISDIGASI